MANAGITHRKIGDVHSKITSIENEFRNAADWMENTGQGVEQGGLDWRGAILKRSPYFFELEEVMGERASTKPLMTSDKLFDLDEETAETLQQSSDTEGLKRLGKEILTKVKSQLRERKRNLSPICSTC